MKTTLKQHLRDRLLAALRQRGLYFDTATVRGCLDAARIP
jgi:hypothetical protein